MCDIKIQIHPLIKQSIPVYYKFGVWQKEDVNVFRKIGRMLVFLFGSIGFAISLVGGSLKSKDFSESLYLLHAGIMVAVLNFKSFLNYSKGNRVLCVLHAVCLHTLPKNEQLHFQIQRKLNKFKEFSIFFVGIILFIVLTFLILYCPIFTSEKKLPFNIWFPFDWRRSAIAHWAAYSYIILCLTFNSFMCLLTLIIWYIMLNCSIKYHILGHRFKNLGTLTRKKYRKNIFLHELIASIKIHQQFEVDIKSMKNLFSDLFFAQIGTSALCICGSVYALTFNGSASFDQSLINFSFLLYCIFDIFVLAYLGNEIKIISNQLPYCLFESNWINETESCKNFVLIAMELVIKPQEMIIGKLYPLDLQTFTAILRGAYSMLNILRNI